MPNRRNELARDLAFIDQSVADANAISIDATVD
jgi:hypothetical protein